MKKTIFLFVCMFTALTSSAQLEVKYDGSTRAGLDDFASYWYIQLGGSSTRTTGYSIGVAGNSVMSAPTGGTAGVSCGVHGRAKNINCGMTYGVAGDLHSSCTGGAGVIGSTYGILGYCVPGKYAGYFYGDTYVNGTLTATSIVQSSDKRLKENITPLSNLKNNTLDRLLDVNIVSFNYSPEMFVKNMPDSVSKEDAIKNLGIDPSKKHFGVIAQELQTIFPELVEEGQDGYLKVNYIELVPLLIRSIQELKEELDEVKGGSGQIRNAFAPTEEASSCDGDEIERKRNIVPINVNGQSVGVKRINQR